VIISTSRAKKNCRTRLWCIFFCCTLELDQTIHWLYKNKTDSFINLSAREGKSVWHSLSMSKDFQTTKQKRVAETFLKHALTFCCCGERCWLHRIYTTFHKGWNVPDIFHPSLLIHWSSVWKWALKFSSLYNTKFLHCNFYTVPQI
jgi:hypothetical protein